MKKYEFTGETIQFEGRTLKQIRFLKPVGPLEIGTIGGWIEGEHNLSHEDGAYVIHDGKVFDNARIEGISVVGNHAVVKDNAQLKGHSIVYANSVVGADSILVDTEVSGNSTIFFYKTSNEELEYNLFKSNIYGNSVIEGTGKIECCNYRNIELEGFLSQSHEYKR